MPGLNPQKHLAPMETKLLIGGRKGQVRERKIAVLVAVFQRDPGDFVRSLGNLEAQFVQKTTDIARELQLRFSWVHRGRSGENQGSTSLDRKLHDW